ncbi:MAG: ParB/RepB/Spo0J family partition protein [Saprospiraceae bacterium]|jgi:ParB family chromosome partitioning protein|nr:ParB/RepB/Spo0J family partition protein [Saprospiraceae bacterium]HRD79870.1 ParB/RepB/Spo0J family partition protein [Saprospiraceae bacterium]HRJ15469.1 ParB/RepB/Spo0J family partition protein [Saprospiraceae bacterium]HRK79869.1 ParB/RepB/Spo0J family partition protein [Saprospiraceae bacterium]
MAKKIERKPTVQAEKQQLAAGLKAIFSLSDKEIEEKQEEVVKELSHTVAMIPVDQIEVNPWQPRNEFDETALAELSESVKVHGLIQPITVRRLSPNAYQLISGERRLRASKMAGLIEVPAYIRLANDQEMLEMALVENIQREDLNAIEVAITLQRLKEECSLTDESLSDRMGKKRSTVTNYLRLLKLPPNIQKSIKDREISMGHARVLAGIDDYAVRDSLYRQTIKEGLSVRDLEHLAAALSEDRPKKAPKERLPDAYDDVQKKLRELFGTAKVQIKLQGQSKGQIVLPFDTVDQFNAYLEHLEK